MGLLGLEPRTNGLKVQMNPKVRSRLYHDYAFSSGTARIVQRRISAPKLMRLTVRLTVVAPSALPSPRLPDDLQINPPDPGVGAAPGLLMAGPVELCRVDPRQLGQPIE